MSENQQILDEMFKDNKITTTGTPDEIICIIDRSGSMGSIQEDAQNGFNHFLAEQKDVPGEANLTLVEFDHECNEIYNRANLKSVEQYTLNPRGCTALLDAIGRTLNSQPEFSKETKVIVVIVTDGGENSSKEYTRSQVFDLITSRREQGWEFLFLAADQDAISVGVSMGIASNKSANFARTASGTYSVHDTTSKYISSYRHGLVDVNSDVNLNDLQEQNETLLNKEKEDN